MEQFTLLPISILSAILGLVSAGYLIIKFREPVIKRPILLLSGAFALLGVRVILTVLVFWTDINIPTSIPVVMEFVSAILIFVSFVDAAKIYRRYQRNHEISQTKNVIFETAVHQFPDLFSLKDDAGCYLVCNQHYAEFLGVKDLDFMGQTDEQLLSVDQATRIWEHEKKAIETKLPFYVEEEYGANHNLPYTLTYLPLFDASGKYHGIAMVGRNSIDFKNAQVSLACWETQAHVLAEAQNELTPFPGRNTDLHALLEKTVQWGCKMSDSQHVGIWHVEKDAGLAVLLKGAGRLGDSSGVRIKAGEDIAGKIIITNEPLFISDYQGWENQSGQFREYHFVSALGVPICENSRVQYILSIYFDPQPQPLINGTIKNYEALAHMVSSRLNALHFYNGLRFEIKEYQQKITEIIHRVRFEHLIAMVSTYFIGINPEKIDEAIFHSLQSISKITGIDRCYLDLFPKEGNPEFSKGIRYNSWLNSSQMFVVTLNDDESQWIQGKIAQAEIIHVSTRSLPSAESQEWQAWLQQKGVSSFTAIPMIFNRTLVGYFGLEAIQGEVDFSSEMIAILKLAAEMFVNVLDRKWAAKSVHDAQHNTFQRIQRLEQKNSENEIITEMGDLLQACRTSDEAYPIITRYIQRLIPLWAGSLYMIHDPKDPAERVAAWGEKVANPAENELVINECWSIRRGKFYVVHDPSAEPICGHIKGPIKNGYICVPLIAQGSAVGVLHLHMPENLASGQRLPEEIQHLATKIAEYIAMPLTNLKLRDNLRSQAIRDPLTGLFNRRYMEETLDREIRRAIRHKTTVGIIMFDIDKMKPINDQFGHDAGDLLLRSLGSELLGMFRGEDVACRYGGDEFTIVLPEASLAEVWRRAEQLRDRMRRLDLMYNGKPLGKVSLSIGVAAFPDHGQTTERVLLACDAASYAAKTEGGDRIMVGHRADT